MSRTPIQKLSDKQERRTAEKLQGTVNAGSGNGWMRRQDVRTDEYLVENKRTGKKQITVKASDWKQLRHHALQDDRMPLMSLELDGRNYIMMEEDDFVEHFTSG